MSDDEIDDLLPGGAMAPYQTLVGPDEIRRFARAVAAYAAAAEREACAKIAADMDYGMGDIAAAIRARGVR